MIGHFSEPGLCHRDILRKSGKTSKARPPVDGWDEKPPVREGKPGDDRPSDRDDRYDDRDRDVGRDHDTDRDHDRDHDRDRDGRPRDRDGRPDGHRPPPRGEDGRDGRHPPRDGDDRPPPRDRDDDSRPPPRDRDDDTDDSDEPPPGDRRPSPDDRDHDRRKRSPASYAGRLPPPHKPQCTPEGHYEPQQCNRTHCWCVDYLGKTVDQSHAPRDQANLGCSK